MSRKEFLEKICLLKAIAKGIDYGEIVQCSSDCAWFIDGFGCAIKALGEISVKDLAKN